VELVLVQADGQMRAIPLDDSRHVIGRGKEADLRIAVDVVSREHCEVLVQGSAVKVRDLGSSNGTFVNCQRVDEEDLSAGDLIAVGPAVFVVRIDGEPADIDPEDAYEDGAPSTSPGLPSTSDDGETSSGTPTSVTSEAPPAPAPQSGVPADDLDDSSVLDFDFSDLDDDEDEQPSL